MINEYRLNHFRALLICCQIESAGLSAEVHSSFATPERKRDALKRYSEVVAELRTISSGLRRLTGRC
jgi:hypothetical protein